MPDELSDKVKSQIEEILSKFPVQRDFDLTKFRRKVLRRLAERLPLVLTALVLEVIWDVGNEELGKFGRSKPCKHWLGDSQFCKKGKEWGSVCFNCEDYEPVEEE